ncbi:hypothetical protein DPMN_129361 [Dreissena polymorpha]|uniref:Uncharacterized protein n=1 Tax=Dreissena polymorpha TaxID=45954 RepID=A0A9D4H118_DREPO|nr:hypothetical protein DPMN_129361 [Dreissena polymorpha]
MGLAYPVDVTDVNVEEVGPYDGDFDGTNAWNGFEWEEMGLAGDQRQAEEIADDDADEDVDLDDVFVRERREWVRRRLEFWLRARYQRRLAEEVASGDADEDAEEDDWEDDWVDYIYHDEDDNDDADGREALLQLDIAEAVLLNFKDNVPRAA